MSKWSPSRMSPSPQPPVFILPKDIYNNWEDFPSNSTQRSRIKVRQKSKSSGASPQKYPPSPGFQLQDEFINIITSCESVDYPERLQSVDFFEYHDQERDFLGIGSRKSSRSNSNASYGSSKLLQVPSNSALYPWGPSEEDYTREGRTQRSSSITVPNHRTSSHSAERIVRRCSSASPRRRQSGESTLKVQNHGQSGQREKIKRRRSSGFRRASSQFIGVGISVVSSSNSSLSSPGSPRKKSPGGGVIQGGLLTSVGLLNLGRLDKKKREVEEKRGRYDVVIIGSSSVGKSTLSEYFDRGGSSGSDQGIGSEEDSDDCNDQDLCSGKAILFNPSNSSKEYNFSIRILTQSTSAVNHLYKYDGVLILYSVTDRDSFNFARRALKEMDGSKIPGGKGQNGCKKHHHQRVVILVGNKTDLERSRSVSSLEGRSLATAYDCKFIEISSSLEVGIEELKKGLATQVYLRLVPPPSMITSSYSDSSPEPDQDSSSNSTSSLASSSHLIPSHLKKSQRTAQRGQVGERKKSSGINKLTAKLINKLISMKNGGTSKSCLDLHSL